MATFGESFCFSKNKLLHRYFSRIFYSEFPLMVTKLSLGESTIVNIDINIFLLERKPYIYLNTKISLYSPP